MIKVISFDVFDTAVIRLVNRPKDVFRLVEMKIDSNYSIKSDFARKRIASEESARRKSIYDEVNLDEIYEEVHVEGVESKVAQEIEILCELDVCRANPGIAGYFRQLVDEGAKIVFVSDMYLSSVVIERILRSCGYGGFYKVYTSSDARCSKRTGALFSFVLKDLDIKSYELQHIGDNLKNDYLRPKLKFINSKYYKSKEHTYGTSMYEHIVTRLAKYGRGSSSFGYSAMGPFVLGFVDWIHRNTCGKEKVFFLSRDGYLLKQVYDLLFPDENTYYLRVSRKALRNASMSSKVSFVDYCKTIPPFEKYDGYMIMDLLDLSVNDLLSRGFDGLGKLEDTILWQDLPYSQLFESIYLLSQEIHGNVYEEQCSNFREYLLQNDFQGSIAVVDLSFKGTAFNLIRNFCENNNIKVQMDGYVIGKSQLMEKRIGESARYIHGWIFEDEINNPFAKVLISAATLYERLLFDSCGTTLSYRKDNETGLITAVLAENGEQKNVMTIEKERENILNFIDDVKPYFSLQNNQFDGIVMISTLIKYFMFPFDNNVNELGDMVEDNTIVRCIAKPDSLKKYFVNPQKILKDLQESFWKQGFLYRLFRSKLIVKAFNYSYFKKKGIRRKERTIFYNTIK